MHALGLNHLQRSALRWSCATAGLLLTTWPTAAWFLLPALVTCRRRGAAM